MPASEIPPAMPVDAYWDAEDGTRKCIGSNIVVCDKAPDENGNIVLSAADVGAITSAQKGQANGVAETDSNNKVSAKHLPTNLLTYLDGEVSETVINDADTIGGKSLNEIEAQLDGKADLVDGRVKKDQLPEIQTDQVVEQPDTPTSPNTILWVDTDAETPGVDIEGIKATAEGAKAEAELAHATADGAITRLNEVDETVTSLENAIAEINTQNTERDSKIDKNTSIISNLKEGVSSLYYSGNFFGRCL